MALSPRFDVYPAYYATREMSDAELEQILREQKIITDVYSFGWISPNMRRITENMYRKRTLHPPW
jgi:hypothetical protein